jgi:hypothetical protein
VLVFIALILILLFSVYKYFELKKWDENLHQLELLEETIYKEVLQAKTN